LFGLIDQTHMLFITIVQLVYYVHNGQLTKGN